MICSNISHRVTWKMEKLESTQYSAALAMRGTWRGTSRENLYDELGWEPLLLRRWSRRLIFFYNIVKNWTPDYARYAIPILQTAKYNLRRHTKIGQICARTRGFTSGFYSNWLLELERHDPEIRQSSSIIMKIFWSIIRPHPKTSRQYLWPKRFIYPNAATR